MQFMTIYVKILEYFRTLVKNLFRESACFNTASFKIYMTLNNYIRFPVIVKLLNIKIGMWGLGWTFRVVSGLLLNCYLGDFVKQAWQPCSRPLLPN